MGFLFFIISSKRGVRNVGSCNVQDSQDTNLQVVSQKLVHRHQQQTYGFILMEDECCVQASSYSWWWVDSHHTRPYQSQWLETTLSDLDEKIKTVLNIIEENGDSLAKRAETYYKRRPELIKTVKDLHRSFRSLAEKYDQLRPDCTEAAPPPDSNPFKQAIVNDAEIKNPKKSQFFKTPSLDFDQYLNRLGNQEMNTMSSEPHKNDPKKKDEMNRQNCDDDGGGSSELESESDVEKWNEVRLKVWKLIEENQREQGELIRRNEEKRDAIRGLSIRIDGLMEENRALKRSLANSNHIAKQQRRSRMSKIKEVILGKFTC